MYNNYILGAIVLIITFIAGIFFNRKQNASRPNKLEEVFKKDIEKAEKEIEEENLKITINRDDYKRTKEKLDELLDAWSEGKTVKFDKETGTYTYLDPKGK